MKSLYRCPKCGKEYLDIAHEVNSLCVYCKTPAIEVKQLKRVPQTTILTESQIEALDINGWELISASEVKKFPKHKSNYLVNEDKVIALKGSSIIVTLRCAFYRGLFEPYKAQVIDSATGKWNAGGLETKKRSEC